MNNYKNIGILAVLLSLLFLVGGTFYIVSPNTVTAAVSDTAAAKTDITAAETAITAAETDITATVEWRGMTSVDLQLQLERRVGTGSLEDVGSPVSLSAGSESYTWSGMEKYSDPPTNSKPFIYSVREVDPPANAFVTRYKIDSEAPQGYLHLINTSRDLVNGDHSTRPCQLNWSAAAFINTNFDDYSNQNYTQKIKKSIWPKHTGVFEMQHFILGNTLVWRVPLATDYAITDGVISIDFSGMNWEPNLDSLVFYSDETPVAGQGGQYWLDRFNPGLGSEYTVLKTNPADIAFTKDQLTIKLPYMPPKSAIYFQFTGKPVPTGNAMAEAGTSYGIKTDLTANYNCVKVVKLWEGDKDPRPDVTFQLKRNGIDFGDPIVMEGGTPFYICSHLDIYDPEGKPYVYTVDEINLPENYVSAGAPVVEDIDDHVTSFTFTNRYIGTAQPNSPEPSAVTPKPGTVAPKTGDAGNIGLFVFAVLLTGAFLLETRSENGTRTNR